MATTSNPVAKKDFQPGAWHFAALIAGNVALALGPWLVRLADTGPVSAGFWRMLLPLPLFAFLALREDIRRHLDRRTFWLVLAAGLFFALDLASWHIGIERTRLGNSTLFGNAGSLLFMAWGLVALRRGPNRAEAAALGCAVLGSAILLGESLEISTRTLAGDLFCLLAGVFYVFYLIPAQRARSHLGQWSVLLLVGLAAAPVLLGVAIGLGEPVWPGPAGFAPVIALAFSSQIVGQGLLVYSLRYFPPIVVGMALLTQPAVAAVVGWFAFGEALGTADIAGMLLVSAALVVARLSDAGSPKDEATP